MTTPSSDPGIYRVRISSLLDLQGDLNDIMRNPSSAVIDVVASDGKIGIVYIDATDLPDPFGSDFGPGTPDDNGLPN